MLARASSLVKMPLRDPEIRGHDGIKPRHATRAGWGARPCGPTVRAAALGDHPHARSPTVTKCPLVIAFGARAA